VVIDIKKQLCTLKTSTIREIVIHLLFKTKRGKNALTVIYCSLLNERILTGRPSTANGRIFWPSNCCGICFSKMKARGWSRVAQIHNTHVKVVSEFIGDTKKPVSRLGKCFATTTTNSY
jgi:hypothetical protein